MLRFLSGRKKGRNTAPQNTQNVQQPPQQQKFPGIPHLQQLQKKPQKHCIICKVIVLDGTDLSIEIPKKALGSELYEQVFYSLDLIEKEYFGLQYTDANHVQQHVVVFLIRDWNCPDEHEFGAAGGKHFIEEYMKSQPDLDDADEANRLRQSIVGGFEDYNCYLMPHPGDLVLQSKFTGSIDEMKPIFAEHIKLFAETITDVAAPKKVANQIVDSGDIFYNMMCRYVDIFNSFEFPTPVSITRAIVFNAYESKIQELSNLYHVGVKSITEKMIYTPEEHLKKVHLKHKKKMIDRFGGFQLKLPESENDEKDKLNFTTILDNSIEKLFEDLRTLLQKKHDELLNKAEVEGTTQFDHKMNELNKTENFLMPPEEFEELAKQAKKVGLEEFLKIWPSPPDEFVRKSFFPKIDDLISNYRSVIESRRKVAEDQITKVIEDLKEMYHKDEKLRLLIDDDYTPPEKLQKIHQIVVRDMNVKFGERIKEFHYCDSYIQKSKVRLETELQAQFEMIERDNNNKLTVVQECAETCIRDAVGTFEEDATKILNDGSATKEILIKSHQDIYTAAKKCLDSLNFPITRMYQTYTTKIETDLQTALNKSFDDLSQCEEAKIVVSQKIVTSFGVEFAQEIDTILMNDVYYMDQSEVLKELDIIENQMKPRFVKLITQIGSKSIDDYCQQLKFVASNEKERIVNEYFEKVQSAKSSAEKIINKLKSNYEEEMDSLKFGFELSQLRMAHERLSAKAMEGLHVIQNRQHLIQCQQSLRELLNESFEQRRKSLESLVAERMKIVDEMKESMNAECEDQLRLKIEEDPFITRNEIERKYKRIIREKVEEFNDKVADKFRGNSKGLEDVVKNFKTVLKAKEEFMTQQFEKSRRDADEAIGQLEDRCNMVFRTSLKDLQEQNLGLDAFAKKSFELLEESLTSFGRDWTLPPGERKDEALTSFKLKMKQEIKAIEESEGVKKERVAKALTEAVDSFGQEIMGALDNGQFYEPDVLHKLLEEESKSAEDNLVSTLRSNYVDEEQWIAEYKVKLVEKISQIETSNETNQEKVLVEVRYALDNLVTDAEENVKNGDDLKKHKINLENEARSRVDAKVVGDIGECPNVKSVVEDYFSKTVQQFEKISGEKRTRIWNFVLLTYNNEMDRLMRGIKSVHPETLRMYHERSASRTLDLTEGEYVAISKEHKNELLEKLKSSYRIREEKNNLVIGAASKNLAIGIDLGTTTTCVSVVDKDGFSVVIPDAGGRNLTPSYVHYSDTGEITIGHEAKDLASRDPESTVYDAKRLIGRLYTDSYVQNDMKLWPFEVEADKDNKPMVKVHGRVYRPEQVSALILVRMKEIAKEYLHHEVRDAVITVPASFTDGQRDATRQAAQIAGLNVLHILNEPTAAAIAHAITWSDEDRTVLVFDFGGGTFDVSILKTSSAYPSSVRKDVPKSSPGVVKKELTEKSRKNDGGTPGLQVLTTLGDTHLGGEDIDQNMVNYCVTEFESENNGIKLLVETPGIVAGHNSRAAVKRRLRRMKNDCERVKMALTSAMSATVSLDAVYGEPDLNVTITREKFEEMNEHLFQRSIKIVEKALANAKLDKGDVTDVILVGGSSRIPRVRKLLQDYLHVANEVFIDRNIQESVALGAGIQASILNGGSIAGSLQIKDVQPFSLGIAIKGDLMSVIIPRDSAIPFSKTNDYMTVFDDQPEVEIKIYSGEEELVTDNDLLGSFTLSGIPPGPAGRQTIRVRMAIDKNGILNVKASCESTGESRNLEIKESRGRLSDAQVEEMRRKINQ